MLATARQILLSCHSLLSNLASRFYESSHDLNEKISERLLPIQLPERNPRISHQDKKEVNAQLHKPLPRLS
jgi:hypothetical protein